MPKFKVLLNGRFGEGWKTGDIIEMDWNAARVPVEEGALEIYISKSELERSGEFGILKEAEELRYKCGKCGEKHKKTKTEKCYA